MSSKKYLYFALYIISWVIILNKILKWIPIKMKLLSARINMRINGNIDQISDQI